MNEFTKLKSQVWEFSTLASAKSFCFRSKRILLIILGDDGKYWVSYPAIANKLVNLGYQYAE